jgi:hypothetical protein
MIGDAVEDIGKIGIGVEAVHFGRFDERVNGCCPLTIGIRAGKGPIV